MPILCIQNLLTERNIIDIYVSLLVIIAEKEIIDFSNYNYKHGIAVTETFIRTLKALV